MRDSVTRLARREPSLVNLVQSHVRLKVVERYLIVILSFCHGCASVIFYLLYRREVVDDDDDDDDDLSHSVVYPSWALLLTRHLIFCLLPILPLARVGWTFVVQCYASACIINTLKTFGEKKNEPNSSSAAEPNSSKMGADGVDDSYGIWLTFAVGIGDWCELVLVECVDFIDSL